MAELDALVEHLGTTLNRLNDSERRKLSMAIGRKLRASQKSRITTQKNPDGSAFIPRKFRLRNKRDKIKNKMFNLIKNAKYLRLQHTAQGIAIGFAGRVSRIASVHQYGLRDRVASDGPQVKYAARELLGFTPQEIDMIETEVLNYLSTRL